MVLWSLFAGWLAALRGVQNLAGAMISDKAVPYCNWTQQDTRPRVKLLKTRKGTVQTMILHLFISRSLLFSHRHVTLKPGHLEHGPWTATQSPECGNQMPA